MNKISELKHECINFNVSKFPQNGFKFNKQETIKVEINIDKEDILETIDMNSIVKLKKEFPVFLKHIDSLKENNILSFTDAIENEITSSILPLPVPRSSKFQLSVPDVISSQAEIEKKNNELKKVIKSQPSPVVSCYMVPETLQYCAQKQGYRFDFVQTRKRKRTLPYAETDWFYTADSDTASVKSTKISKRRQKINLTECKALLVKAHHLKAIKEHTRTRGHSMFEVEYIADFKIIQGKRFYLVKWAGWPAEANTWEPITNLSCSGLIQDFHEDYMKKLSFFFKKRNLSWPKLMKPNKLSKHVLQRLYDLIPKTFHFVPEYALKKQLLSAELRTWQKKINLISKGFPMIAVENEVDLEVLPSDFTYIVNNIPGKGVELPTDPILGCQCRNGCLLHLEKGKCCPGCHKGRFAYHDGLIRLKPGRPIFECNSRCNCGLKCPNRVVQRGSQCVISLFRTVNGKGWGVKALQPIVKGSFVMEYVGEDIRLCICGQKPFQLGKNDNSFIYSDRKIRLKTYNIITNEEAEKRGKEYDSNGITYLFDLDFCDSENPLTVDATNYGNISHFVNHSCSPNLQVYNVFIDNLDPSLPRIALFARKNIAINEELTFDYQMTGDMTDGRCVDRDDVTSATSPTTLTASAEDDEESNYSNTSACSSIKKRTRCLCGSTNCRKWLI